MFETRTLSNGLRILFCQSDSPIVHCGYIINAGSRNEEPGEEGLAHFCEHATFKGTQRRTALEICEVLDSVGGDLNAETSKEFTTFYATVQREHFDKALDVLTDIVFNSTYDADELEKEKEVVCDEIESYNDTPSELIYDDMENIIFNGTPLGHNILGDKKTVRHFTSDDVRRFTNKHYRPENMVLYVSGKMDIQFIVHSLEFIVDRVHAAQPNYELCTMNYELPTQNYELCTMSYELTTIRPLSTHQAHVVIANTTVSNDAQERLVTALLSNIIGGPAMSSRLNMALREENGLVYIVESSVARYREGSLWTVYFGCDKEDIDQCLELVRGVLTKLTETVMDAKAFATAKTQLCGQLAISSENRENVILSTAKALLRGDRSWNETLADAQRRIQAVTAEELLDTARHLFDYNKIATLIYK